MFADSLQILPCNVQVSGEIMSWLVNISRRR